MLLVCGYKIRVLRLSTEACSVLEGLPAQCVLTVSRKIEGIAFQDFSFPFLSVYFVPSGAAGAARPGFSLAIGLPFHDL